MPTEVVTCCKSRLVYYTSMLFIYISHQGIILRNVMVV